MMQCDFGYLGLGEEGSGHNLTMVSGKDCRTGFMGGATLDAKGNNAYARAVLNDYLDELGYMCIELHSDGEPAVVALLEGVFADRVVKMGKQAAAAQLRLRHGAKGSHASQGAVESGVKTISGLSRTARLSLEKRST